MLIILLLHLLTGQSFAPVASAGQPAIVRVSVIKIDGQKGDIYAALYATDKGFPMDPDRAFRTARAQAKNGSAQLQFENVPPGTYAIALFHDTNGDGTLNTNLLGIPKEGYGVSNNVKNMFSGPTFRQAAFRHQQETQLTIQVRY
ncbi:MAG TPA: DUF2141 domain-containing protein [Lacibacter sp.]|nr:DUF2141 domain-containing protein [Lacibacter sp.]HMO89127.1 DUF2141 domain-containing protein [Lacibacter sp.]HMP88180.1 DUF2141 domain-containing protein [Lacibacter sp.]